MSSTVPAPDTDADDEQVALVRLPPSPSLGPSPAVAAPLRDDGGGGDIQDDRDGRDGQDDASALSSSILTPSPSQYPFPGPSSPGLPSPMSQPNNLNPTVPTVSEEPIPSLPPSLPLQVFPPIPSNPATLDATLDPGPPRRDDCMICTPESAPSGDLQWIRCDGCKRWAHIVCTALPADTQLSTIDKFHCKRCENTRGPTTFHPPPRKSERSHPNIDYTSLNLGDTTGISPDQHAHNAFFEGPNPRKFAPDKFPRMQGHQLTKAWAELTGCREPVVIPAGQSNGLGMLMPADLTVRKVAEMVGYDTKVEVIDVPTQKEAPNWRMKQWADYYETPAHQRDRVRNVISLEVSSTSLGAQVVRPQFVRDLDLIERVWPPHLRPAPSAPSSVAPVVLPTQYNTPSNVIFPKVTLYCLMSVARSYTDFHIDFGGSSVFYHILRGNKTFLFIEPSPAHLRRYEAWCSDSEQSRRFLGEEVKECTRVDLAPGDTMIIPSGWIHAVYTPTDSLVLGGNFLTPLHIPSQLHVASIETRTRVPKKFRFPFFDLAMWYTALYYLDTYVPKRRRGPPPKAGRRNTQGMSEHEAGGLRHLAEWLWKKSKLRTQQLAKGAEFHRAKVDVPPGVDAVDTATRFAHWVFGADHERDGNDVPAWYRSDVLLQKAGSPRKRKRSEGEDTPVKKYVRKSARKKDERPAQVVTTAAADLPAAPTVTRTVISRPVTSYERVSGPLARPITQTSTWIDASSAPSLAIGPSVTVFKPYAADPPSRRADPSSQSFVNLVKTAYRPYRRPPPLVLEEIKVEDQPPPLGGLHVLSRAVELASHHPADAAPSTQHTDVTSTQPTDEPSTQATTSQLDDFFARAVSEDSPLTSLSASPEDPHERLPTPESESLSPRLSEPRVRDPSHGRVDDDDEDDVGGGSTRSSPRLNRRKTGDSPAGRRRRHDDAEARRLEGLLTAEELSDLRQRRRRGHGYVFGAASLRRELTRLGRTF